MKMGFYYYILTGYSDEIGWVLLIWLNISILIISSKKKKKTGINNVLKKECNLDL